MLAYVASLIDPWVLEEADLRLLVKFGQADRAEVQLYLTELRSL